MTRTILRLLPLPLLACANPPAGTNDGSGPEASSAETDEGYENNPDDEGPAIICEPGTRRCGAEPGILEVCAATGLGWEAEACAALQTSRIPVSAWTSEYVAPHPPLRGGEDVQYWRVFAGADEVTVHVEPESASPPIVLAKRGDWAEFVAPAALNLYFVGDGPFMPVQYVTGFHATLEKLGGPAMLQMLPTSGYLQRYVFHLVGAPETSELRQVVAIVRAAAGAEVLLDDAPIPADAWAPLAGWELAHVEVAPGDHRIDSDDPVGAIVYGYEVRLAGQTLSGNGYATALGYGDASLIAP